MRRTDPRRRDQVRFGRARHVAAGCLWLSLAAVAVAGARAAPDIRPPKLAYTVSTLPKGLRLILHEDHSTPIVNVQVWYHVGSKDERPGRTGFAHLFEHTMFKGSRNVEPDEHTSLISGIGGAGQRVHHPGRDRVLGDRAVAVPAAGCGRACPIAGVPSTPSGDPAYASYSLDFDAWCSYDDFDDISTDRLVFDTGEVLST